jgi:Flp pilus assembly pilin Flp
VIADAITGASRRLSTALHGEDGQTFVEYALIGVLIVIGLVLALTALATGIGATLGKIGSYPA